MKILLLALITYLVKSGCFRFPEVTTSQYYVPAVNIDGVNESVVYIMNENNTDDILLNSLLTGLYSDQSITVLSGVGYKMAPKKRLNRHSNSIILTENLILNELYSGAFDKMLKSHWSPVYIIITTKNGNQSCENGTISQVFLENAQDYMNTIWHKHQIFRIIISFPYTCPQRFIIYSGKKPSNTTLYDRTIKVITIKNKQELKTAILVNSKPHELTVGYPLRASIFYRFPTSITQCDVLTLLMKLNLTLSNGFCGLDGLLMHDFIKHFQYNLTIPQDEKCDVYGFVHPDRNVSGSLGCIIRDQIDISFNSRFLVHYATRDFFYLHYITVDSLAVVLKRPRVIPLWHYAYNTYGASTGTVVAILVIAVGLLMWVTAWLTKQSTNHKPRQLHEYILNALTCTLFGFVIERNSNQFRLLKGTCLFCSIVFLAVYQGNVNYQFTTRTRYGDLKTLKQLFHSKYVLYTSPSIRDLLMSSVNQEDTAQVAYLQRTQIKNESVVGINFIIDHPEAATLERGEDIQMEILLNYTDKNGAPIMYAIDETFHVYYMSYIARSGFPFVEESLRFMMRMLEAGLPHKYYAWTRSTLKLGDTNPKSGTEPRPYSKIELNDLCIAFCVLLFGCFVSTCSFIVEIYKMTIKIYKFCNVSKRTLPPLLCVKSSTSGRKPSNMTLYDRTIKVIQARNKNELKTAILANSKSQELTKGYPLRANIFYRFPTSITECETINHYIKLNLNYTNGFCGLDGLLMHDFINHYKYNLITPRHKDCNKYGYVDPETNSVSGSLRCILRKELDVSFNSRFLVQYNTTKNYFYLHYITTDSLAVALKRSEVVPLWHYAHNTYGYGTGSILSILIIVLGVLTWTSAWVTSEITGHKPRKLYFYILNAVTCTLFGFSIERRSDRFRILKGTCLFCSIILLAFYQGNVNYQFTTRTRFREIRTLQQLFRSKVVIYTSSSIRTLLLNIMNTNDQAQTTFLQRTQIKNSSKDLGFVLDHPNAGTIARGEDAQIDILRNFTNEDGNSLVYTVEEVFHVYYLSYVSRTGFLFVEESLRFMMRMLEAGLPHKYYVWTRRTLTLGDTYPKTGPEPRSCEKVRLSHLRVAFCVLLLGCLVSLCSFLVEVHRGKRSTKQ